MADGDVIVVGSGPNGLSAAVALAREGCRVTVLEGRERIGGGASTRELTLPGFHHDVCSAVHPMGAGSPFFRELPLAEHGLEWIHPPVPLAHPFDDGTAATLLRSVSDTAATLGPDSGNYRRLMEPLVRGSDDLLQEALGPLVRFPRHPLLMARMGLLGLRSAMALAGSRFEADRARALFVGMAGHTLLPMDKAPSAAFGLMLGLAGHAVGWPIARGGSQSISDALAGVLRAHGGRIETGIWVRSVDELPEADAVLLDLTARRVLEVAGGRFPRRYRRSLERFRYAPGVFKMDWALSEPIPWAAEECRQAGTVHLGGSAEAIAASSRAVWERRRDDDPFVILSQPTLFDGSRAPEGKHIAWGYCHVPNGSTEDYSEAIERQIERYAPGFRDTIVARSAMTTRDVEDRNPNVVGGDINGGLQDLRQLFFRPAARLDPYGTPADGVYICSASTPPGGGVHGMCGYNASRSALKRL